MNLSSIASSGPATYQPAQRSAPTPEPFGQARADTGAAGDVFEKQTINDSEETTYAPPYSSEKTAIPSSDETEETETGDSRESEERDKTQTAETSDEAELSAEERKQIEELKARDQEVKAHEQAHVAAGGRYVRSGAQFEYQTGPDGEKYAVGGEVSIDVSKEPGDPRATITKMQTVIRAALAPAEPSAQDRAVAAKAAQMEMEARGEAMAESRATAMKDDASPSTDKPDATDKTGEAGTETTEAPETRQGARAYTAAMATATARQDINFYA
jgi:hypothetical protein